MEVYGDITARKEMWVVEDQFHPLWGIPNLGKLDCHHYIIDWLSRALIDEKRCLNALLARAVPAITQARARSLGDH